MVSPHLQMKKSTFKTQDTGDVEHCLSKRW